MLTATAFREKDYVTGTKVPKDSMLSNIKNVFKNRNFCLFTLGDLFSYVSLIFFETAMLYYITELIGIAEADAFYVMVSAIAVAIALFPVIIRFGKKHGKKILLIAACLIFTVIFTVIYFGDAVAAMFPDREMAVGLAVGVAVAFPFAAINVLPSSVASDIIQKDSIENGVNREGIFAATKTLIEKMAAAAAAAIVSTVLAIGAPAGASVGLVGIKLTGVIAGAFSLLSVVFFCLYNERSVMAFLDAHRREGEYRES